jgi:hypothetical protein
MILVKEYTPSSKGGPYVRVRIAAMIFWMVKQA